MINKKARFSHNYIARCCCYVCSQSKRLVYLFLDVDYTNYYIQCFLFEKWVTDPQDLYAAEMDKDRVV